MSAPLLGPDGNVSVGIEPAAFKTQGGILDPTSPQAIAGAFANYDAALRGGQPPAQPGSPQVPPSPTAHPSLGAQPPATPVAGASLDPNLAPEAGVVPGAGGEGEDDVSTLADIAASFLDGENQPASLDQLFDSVAHEIDGQSYSLRQIVDGFAAAPGAAQAVNNQAMIQSQLQQQRAHEKQLFDTEMSELGNMHVELKAILDADSNPTRLAQLLNEDPVAFQAKTLELDGKRSRIEASKNEIERKQRDQMTKAQETERTRLSNESLLLAQKYPEWDDPTEGPKQKAALTKTALAYGYTPQEIGNLTDHRDFLVLRDATLGRELRENGKTALKTAKDRKLRAPTSPHAARGEIPGKKEAVAAQLQGNFQNLQRSGTIEDAASVFQGLV